MKKLGISQKQIASDLGVSQTLVSIVLNGRKKGVSKSSYKKIWDHARQSGYRPKGIATDLMDTSKGAGAVGLILRDGVKLYSQSPYFGHIQHGIHEYLSEKGIALLFLGTEHDLDVKLLKQLSDPQTFHGLIMLGEVSRPFLQAMLELDSRVVTVSCQYAGLCNSVLSNEEQAADLLVDHLVELGHESFAWIGGNQGTQRAAHRLRAVKSALHLRDASINPKYCIEVNTCDRKQGSIVSEALLEAAGDSKPPTAWICFNGIMARGAVSCLTHKGYKIPHEISVVAFDQTRVCEEEHPTLTGAATPPELMGRVAAELLLRDTASDQNRFMDTILSSELTPRESSAQAPETS